MENQNIALVNMKRTIEAKKAEKLMKNLHHIDFNDENSSRIQFVSSVDEIKQTKIETNFTQDELDLSLNRNNSTVIPGVQQFKMTKEKE